MKQKHFLLPSILLVVCITSFSQTQLSKRIDSLFISYLDSGLAGSLLVAEQNKITLQKAYGYSNNETKALNTTNTLFNVASIGKHFTAKISIHSMYIEKRIYMQAISCWIYS